MTTIKLTSTSGVTIETADGAQFELRSFAYGMVARLVDTGERDNHNLPANVIAVLPQHAQCVEIRSIPKHTV